MTRTLAGITAVGVLLAVASCSLPDRGTPAAPAASVCVSAPASTAPPAEPSAYPCASNPAGQDDVTAFLAGDDERDGMDCDADDRAKKELPDCGFYAGIGNATFIWWSWARAGRSTPPTGWNARTEVDRHRPRAAATSRPPAATRPPAPATTPGPSRVTTGKPTTKPTKSSKSGGTRK